MPLPEQYGEGSGAETGGEKINPGVKRTGKRMAKVGCGWVWRLSEETFTAVLTFGSVKSLLFFCIMVIAEMAQWQGVCFVRLAVDRD